jgi:hypothetical protein
MEKIISYLGKLTQNEAEEIARSESDFNRGVYVLYPEFNGEEECILIVEYNDNDDIEWGKIYTIDNAPESVINELNF